MEEKLSELHKIISKAGYPICLALVIHRLKKSYLLESRELLIKALEHLDLIIIMALQT